MRLVHRVRPVGERRAPLLMAGSVQYLKMNDDDPFPGIPKTDKVSPINVTRYELTLNSAFLPLLPLSTSLPCLKPRPAPTDPAHSIPPTRRPSGRSSGRRPTSPLLRMTARSVPAERLAQRAWPTRSPRCLLSPASPSRARPSDSLAEWDLFDEAAPRPTSARVSPRLSAASPTRTSRVRLASRSTAWISPE